MTVIEYVYIPVYGPLVLYDHPPKHVLVLQSRVGLCDLLVIGLYPPDFIIREAADLEGSINGAGPFAVNPGGRFEGDAHGNLTQVMLLYSPKQPEPQLDGNLAV